MIADSYQVKRVAIFLVIFLVLELIWIAARGSWVYRLIIDKLTVTSAVFFINIIDSSALAHALDASILTGGLAINILNGCEGIDILFLLLAVMLALPGSWLGKLQRILAMSILVLTLNIVRIVLLVMIARYHRQYFDLVHGFIAPLIMIAVSMLILLATPSKIKTAMPATL